MTPTCASPRALLGGPALGRCAATVSINDGKLFADLAEVEFELGGSGDAQLTVDMTRDEPRYALRGKFADLDMARATETLTSAMRSSKEPERSTSR